MDAIALIGIVAIIIGYLNLFLLLKKDKPIINIYNQMPGLTKYDVVSGTASNTHGTTTEVPIDSIVTIKDIKGDINLDSEKISTSDVSEITEKIKYMRNK